MTIRKDDGLNIINFIEKTLNIKLPKQGFLAGQSVCSTLLYLKNKSKDFHINDLDIFLPKNNLHFKEIVKLTNKQNLLIQNMNGLTNQYKDFSIDIYSDSPMMKIEDKQIYLGEINKSENEIILKLKNYRNYLEKEKHPEIDKRMKKYEEITRRNIRYIIDSKYTHNTNKNISFFMSKPKKIFDSTRNGIFNYIYTENIYLDGFCFNVLNDFDINCTQVGIDLSTKKILYTPNFLNFYNTLYLEIINANTPYHTIIRYFNKIYEFNYKGSIEFESNYIHNQLNFGIFSKNLNSKNKLMKTCFGNIYINKYNKTKEIKDFFKIKELKSDKNKIINYRKKNNLAFKDYPLYKLNSKGEDFEYIKSGEHKKDFTKNTGFNIESGYSTYVHCNLKKIMKNKTTYNKKLYFSLKSNLNLTDIKTKTDIENIYNKEEIDENKLIDIIKMFPTVSKGLIYNFNDFNDLYRTVEYIYNIYNKTNSLEVKKFIKEYKYNHTYKNKNNLKIIPAKGYIYRNIKLKLNKIIEKEEKEKQKNKKVKYNQTKNSIFNFESYIVNPVCSLHDLHTLSQKNKYNYLLYNNSIKNGEIEIYSFSLNEKYFTIVLSKENNNKFNLIHFYNLENQFQYKESYLKIIELFLNIINKDN